MNSEAFDLLEDYLEEKSDVFASIENSEVMFKKFPIISHNWKIWEMHNCLW